MHDSKCAWSSAQILLEAPKPESELYLAGFDPDVEIEDHREWRMRHVRNHVDLPLSLVAAA
jgi:hypothetical protein